MIIFRVTHVDDASLPQHIPVPNIPVLYPSFPRNSPERTTWNRFVNTSQSDDETELQQNALIALISECPAEYAPTIIVLFYERNMTNDKRQMIISALSESIKNVEGRSKGERNFISRFHPVAGHFLFPILRNWDKNKKTLLLETSDKDILCRLIALVGQIISNLEWIHMFQNSSQHRVYIGCAVKLLGSILIF